MGVVDLTTSYSLPRFRLRCTQKREERRADWPVETNDPDSARKTGLPILFFLLIVGTHYS